MKQVTVVPLTLCVSTSRSSSDSTCSTMRPLHGTTGNATLASTGKNCLIASYDDLHSSGPEESLSSYYVKVTLKDGRHVTCKLHAEDARNLPRCINCYFFITSWVRLICRHNLCIECFKNSMTFVCPVDSTKTFQYQASMGSCTYDGTWKDVLIECPSCETPKVSSSIANHIEKEHPVTQRKSRTPREDVQEQTELCSNNEPRNLSPSGNEGRNPEFSNPEPSKLHEDVGDTKTDKKQPCDHQALAEYNLHSSQSSDREISITKQPRPPRRDKDANEVLTIELPKERTGPCTEKDRRDHNFAGVNGGDCEPSNPEQSTLPQPVIETKKDDPEPRSKDQRHDRNFTSSVGRGREFPNNEQSNLPPPVNEAKEEHEDALSKYFTECTICKINIFSKDFVKHERLCQGQSRNEREASPGAQQEDGSAEKEDQADQIQELKHKINLLEDRLEDIEQPLLLILGRLYENHLNTFESV